MKVFDFDAVQTIHTIYSSFPKSWNEGTVTYQVYTGPLVQQHRKLYFYLD